MVGRVDLMHLRCFVAVADELSFARAAARVNLEPSPLSRRVRALEAELGERLFDRSNRAVRLTPAGARMLPEVREILDRVDRLAATAKRARRAAPIRVGLAPGVHPLAREWLLATLDDAVPGATAQLDVGGSTALLERVRSGALEAAFVHDRPSASAIDGLPVTIEPLGVAIARDDPLAAHERLRLADLAGARYLTSAEHTAPGYLAQVTEALRAAGVVSHPLPPYDLTQASHLVASGMGFVLVPLNARSQLRGIYETAGVAIVPLADTDLVLTTWLIWNPRHAEDRPALAALVRVARSREDRPIVVAPEPEG